MKKSKKLQENYSKIWVTVNYGLFRLAHTEKRKTQTAQNRFSMGAGCKGEDGAAERKRRNTVVTDSIL